MLRTRFLAVVVVVSIIFTSPALFERTARADVMFDFVFTDGSDVPGDGGFFDPLSADGAANLMVLTEAASSIGSLLDHSATVEIGVSTYSDASDSTLASAGGFYYVDPTAMGVIPNSVQETILFGAASPGPTDGFMMVNTAKSYYNGMDAGLIGAGEKDLYSVFVHELTHALAGPRPSSRMAPAVLPTP